MDPKLKTSGDGRDEWRHGWHWTLRSSRTKEVTLKRKKKLLAVACEWEPLELLGEGRGVLHWVRHLHEERSLVEVARVDSSF
jgi:exosome complex RNA-binding protein Csl4